jgi:DNA-binding transcriptional regulator LsrR (DeoR family)
MTDIQTVESTPDAENTQMEMIAKLAAQILSNHYPAHVWMVGWAPGMTLVIKNMALDARYGYTVDAGRAASVSQLEHAVMMGGGELLERMGMKRGAWDGEFAGQAEGIPL